jgi:hypothetical protein
VVLTPRQALLAPEVREPVAGLRGVTRDEGTECGHGDGR